MANSASFAAGAGRSASSMRFWWPRAHGTKANEYTAARSIPSSITASTVRSNPSGVPSSGRRRTPPDAAEQRREVVGELLRRTRRQRDRRAQVLVRHVRAVEQVEARQDHGQAVVARVHDRPQYFWWR